MRIEPGNSNIPPASGRWPGRVNKRGLPSLTSSEPASDATVSAEISPLLADLEGLPDIRTELVEEVRQRLNRGEHLTRDAAERTAEAILADLANFIGQ